MSSIKTLIFTCANAAYEDFAPLYAASALMHSQSSLVEIGVEDAERFLTVHGGAWRKVEDRYPHRTLLRTVAFPPKLLPNTVRFITAPVTTAHYVYIGDIDIIILDKDFPEMHISHMEKHSLRFSNIVRPNTNRMSGLHFAEYTAYYPIPDTSSLTRRMSDEQMLYALCELKGLSISDASHRFRPLHGIHASPNRMPNISERGGRKIPGWGWQPYASKWFAFSTDPLIADLRPHLSNRLRGYLDSLDELCAQPFAAIAEPPDFGSAAGAPMQMPAATFTRIYENNAWRGSESKSGPSSSLRRTSALREALPGLINQYCIATLLDAPCGDFHWMQHVVSNATFKYIGADIVVPLIRRNSAAHASSNTLFVTLDITKDPLPTADLFFCRDCLFHLSYEDIALVFRNFLRSQCSYILTTSHINKRDFNNTNIKTGKWRWFDLFKPPFNLEPNFRELILDGGGDRYMYLWVKEDVSPQMEIFINTTLGAT